MINELSAEAMRLEANTKLDPSRKSELGQFMAPLPVAHYMASLFVPETVDSIRLLDAGAGVGTLTSAFLERWFSDQLCATTVQVTAYEVDPLLRSYAKRLLASYQQCAQQQTRSLGVDIESRDFIEDAVDRIQFWNSQNFTHAILNPPYKKIHSQSQHRKSLHTIGVETVNLYSAFVALTIQLMADGGEIVAIVPRSFCNGPYYRPFRQLLLAKTAIQHIHLFTARDEAFKDDDVLQENIIIHLIKSGKQETVTISSSTDDSFADYQIYESPFEEIVLPKDPEQFIHIPMALQAESERKSPTIIYSLAELGVQISTGPVVDFRLAAYLRELPGVDTVPLLYPVHFSEYAVAWPKPAGKKPNALQRCVETEKWLLPNGYYTVIRRFSSKEEKRRIVASIVEPGNFASDALGFENHLNVFHQNKRGLPESLARGLMVYLNSTLVDENFRRFSGHTQVNATDLRLMKYPSIEILKIFGEWAASQKVLTQQAIDNIVTSILCHNNR